MKTICMVAQMRVKLIGNLLDNNEERKCEFSDDDFSGRIFYFSKYFRQLE